MTLLHNPDLYIIGIFAVWGLCALFFITWIIATGLWRLTSWALSKVFPAPLLPPSDIEALIPIVMCPICSPGPRPGTCTCTAACGEPACVFAHTGHTGLTAADERYLAGKGDMP